MKKQYGGLYPNNNYQAFLDQVGQKLVNYSIAKETGYQYDFHLLADSNTITPLHFLADKFLLLMPCFQNLKMKIN